MRHTWPQKRRGPLLHIAALCLLISGVLWVMSINSTRTTESAFQQAENTLFASVQAQQTTLAAIFESQSSILESFANTVALEDSVDFSSLPLRMNAVVESSYFYRVAYITPDGAAYFSDGATQNVAAEPYFQQAMGGERAIQYGGASTPDTPSFVFFAVPVQNADGIQGVLYGSHTEISLQRLFKAQAPALNDTFYLFDASGQMILNGNDVDFRIEKDMQAFLSQVSQDPEDKQAAFFHDLEQKESGTLRFTYEGTEYYAVYMPFAIEDWFILNAVPESVLFSEVENATRNDFPLFVLIISFALLCLFFILLRESTTRKLLMKEAQTLRENEKLLRVREEEYRIATQQSGKAVFRYDIASQTSYRDSGSEDPFGYADINENMPESILQGELIAEESREDYRKFFAKIREGISPLSANIRLHKPSGDSCWLRHESTTIFDEEGRPLQAIISYYDVTEQREKELAYEKWKQSVAQMDREKIRLFEYNLNQDQLESCFGGLLPDCFVFPETLSFNQRVAVFAEKSVFSDDRQNYLLLMNRERLLAALYNGTRELSQDFRVRLENGAPYWLRLSLQMIEYPESAEIKLYVLYTDINEEKSKELELKDRSERDPLTKALNRAAFIQQMEQLLAKRAPQQKHAFFMLDIDDFKLVNDTFGHAAGDELLKDIAKRLQVMLRQDDLVGRLGGDEFMLCIKDVPLDTVVHKKAQQICETLRKQLDVGIQISVSVGISVYPRDGSAFDQLYRNADRALYQAKERGKDGYVFYSEEEKQKGKAFSAATSSVRKAGIKKRMLVVDESLEDWDEVRDFFEESFHILLAETVSGALEILERYSPNLDLCLVNLPSKGKDRFTLLRQIEDDLTLRSIPVIVVSDTCEEGIILQALEKGASDYVCKPVNPRLLRLRIQNILTKSENDLLRIQNNYLLLKKEAGQRFRLMLANIGVIMLEFDWLNKIFLYDSQTSTTLKGVYDDRPLWRIFIEDQVAEESQTREMQELIERIAHSKEENSGQMKMYLQTQQGEKRWFRMNVLKKSTPLGDTSKLLLSFIDVHNEVLAEEKLRNIIERD